MTERLDHETEAVRIIFEDVKYDMEASEKLALFAEAQAHATLALVEQQKVANLIALEVVTEPREHASYLMCNTQIDADARYPVWELKPEIKEALGL